MNEKNLWFKAKRYGWGWTPSSWQGWLVLLWYLGTLYIIFKRIDGVSNSASDTLQGVVLPFLLVTGILIAICYKTGEKPGWHWGDK